jgi:spore germination cell wall hydrolase CwlJ-like protein
VEQDGRSTSPRRCKAALNRRAEASAAGKEIELLKLFRVGRAPAILAACILSVAAATGVKAQTVASASSPPKIDYQLTVLATSPAKAAAATPTGPVIPARSAVLSSVARPATGTAPPSGAVAVRPAVTQEGLWPLIWENLRGAALDEELNCVAVAIYHEARGEPFPGQLAVAEVIMNRAHSGRYPTTLCGVVKQPWQFSFVRAGRFPAVNTASPAWSYAQSIARIASKRLADALPEDVLWYHADYVAPVWGRRLSRVEKIGAHIFYRS